MDKYLLSTILGISKLTYKAIDWFTKGRFCALIPDQENIFFTL